MIFYKLLMRSERESSGGLDSNQRPLAPHANALPGCATTRIYFWSANVLLPANGGRNHLKSPLNFHTYKMMRAANVKAFL